MFSFLRRFARLSYLCVSSLLLIVFSGLVRAEAPSAEWVAVTENFPPYNYLEEGKAAGYSTELVKNLASAANIPLQIELLPWSRAMLRARTEPNVLIFSMLRTPEREDRYHWVGPIDDMSIYVWQLRDTDIEAIQKTKGITYAASSSLDEANIIMLEDRFSVNRKSVSTVETTEQLFGMLLKRRVHRIVLAENIWRQVQATLAPEVLANMQRVDLLATRELYLAASLQTPLKDIRLLQEVFSDINQSQRTLALRESYRLF